MKYHAWYHLYPTGHNTIVITAGLGSITENEAPANAPKHPWLPSSYPGAIIVFTYYHALPHYLGLLRCYKRRQNSRRSWKLIPMNAVLRETFPCILRTNHLCLPSPAFYGIFSKPSPVLEAEKHCSSQGHCPSCIFCLGMDDEWICGLGMVASFHYVWLLTGFVLWWCIYPSASWSLIILVIVS